MRVVAMLDVAIQIIEKNGLFYTQILDTETLNLVFEEESLTRQGAENTAATWIVKQLGSQGK